jgi:nucleoside-diphosphate-sugar epimerase
MKIVVTGAAGFIGSHVAESLVNLWDLGNIEVVGIDVVTDYYDIKLKERNISELQKKGVAVLRADLSKDEDQQLIKSTVRDAEVVIHLAAQPGISATTSFNEYLRNNVIATENLLSASESARNLKLFLNVATSSVYGYNATDTEDVAPKPASWYGATKLAAESLALARFRSNGMPVTSFRLFSVYGPRERPDKLIPILTNAIIKDEEFPLFKGSKHHKRSFTYIADIVDGIIAAVRAPDQVVGEIFNIGCDANITTGEVIEIVEKLVGKKVRIKELPSRLGDQLETKATITKIRKRLGFEPRTMPEDGIARYIEWATRS